MRTPTYWSSLRAHAFALIGSVALVASGCAPHQPPSALGVSPSAEPALCQLVPPPRRMADSLWIAATDRVIPAYAPNAHTIAEHVVFPLLYSIPIAPHCDSIVAGPMVAVVPPPVELTERQPAISRELVVEPFRLGYTWSPRTGPYEIAAATDSSLDLLPHQPSIGPHVRFTAIDDPQGRDAINAGADVVLTSDPGTIAYAAAQSNLTSVPLIWDRVYVLIEPAGRNHGDRDSVLSVQRDLATNALHVEARPASDSGGTEVLACPRLEPAFVDAPTPALAAPGPTPRPRIVYEKDDGVARAISERLVAFAQARSQRLAALESVLSSAGAARTVGLDSAAFRQVLSDGNEAAYVMAVPLFMGSCATVDGLEFDTRWLGAGRNNPVEDHIVPLVETRARAIMRREHVGLALDGVGNIYLLFGPPPS